MSSPITAAQTDAIFAKIRSGKWRAHVQAANWVGHAIAEVLDLDMRDADDRAKVKAALRTWIASGKLRVVTARDEKSFFKQFVEVAVGRQ